MFIKKKLYNNEFPVSPLFNIFLTTKISTYRYEWEGKVQEEPELLLVKKINQLKSIKIARYINDIVDLFICI